ncbi:MAG: cupin domain-containing protein [Bacteroidota bacterium]
MEKIRFETIEKNDRFKVLRGTGPLGAQMKPHIADRDGFLIVEDGQIRFDLNGEDHPMNEGDSIRIPASTIHHLSATKDCKLLLMFDTAVKIRFVENA